MARGHANIINYFLHKEVDDVFYIFLEYANGGELFDQIGTIVFNLCLIHPYPSICISEPDIGMPEHRVRHYFTQLISGVAHLHKLGIAHRDIKPENLLITEKGTC
jgi:serine/threonine-protein kinase Chk1